MCVVLHDQPDKIFFYVNTPQVRSGMNLTTNCLLEILSCDADLRASSLRLQYDGLCLFVIESRILSGSSENVNYAMHCLCGLLVHLGIFEHVFANRLPVGHTHFNLDALNQNFTTRFSGKEDRGDFWWNTNNVDF